jgi:acyl CoA:acetate/3-ketoacid CoA transferase beta subunit
MLHAENGILGYGGINPNDGEWDTDLINAIGERLPRRLGRASQ